MFAQLSSRNRCHWLLFVIWVCLYKDSLKATIFVWAGIMAGWYYRQDLSATTFSWVKMSPRGNKTKQTKERRQEECLETKEGKIKRKLKGKSPPQQEKRIPQDTLTISKKSWNSLQIEDQNNHTNMFLRQNEGWWKKEMEGRDREVGIKRDEIR